MCIYTNMYRHIYIYLYISMAVKDGMRMNLKKTKVMLNRFYNDKSPITVNGEAIDEVQE